jgi:hypothetical protein
MLLNGACLLSFRQRNASYVTYAQPTVISRSSQEVILFQLLVDFVLPQGPRSVVAAIHWRASEYKSAESIEPTRIAPCVFNSLGWKQFSLKP